MDEKFIKFRYYFQKIYVYKDNLEIKGLFKSETIKKSQIKGTTLSSFNTKLKIYVDGHKDLDINLFDSKKVKDLYKHLNGGLTFEDLYQKYSSENKEVNKNPFFGKILANIFGILILFFGFVLIFSYFISGLLILIAGLIIFPKTYSLFERKTNITLTKKSRVIIGFILILVSMPIMSNSDNDVDVIENNSVSEKVEEVAEENTDVVEEENQGEPEVQEEQIESQPVQEEPEPAIEEVSKPEVDNSVEVYQPTLGERQALLSAQNYLEYTAFSRSGLIEQLEYEGYSSQEAEYALGQLSVNWNQQAALSAENYLEYSAFSRSGLIEQLQYEGFTRSQAEYGAEAVGY